MKQSGTAFLKDRPALKESGVRSQDFQHLTGMAEAFSDNTFTPGDAGRSLNHMSVERR